MNDPIQIFQTLAALLALFSAGWLLLNAKRFSDAQQSILTGLIGIACSGYLLCEVVLPMQVSAQRVVPFLRAAVGLEILALGLLPLCLNRVYRRNSIPRLAAHLAFAAILLVLNYLSELSLLHRSLSFEDNFADSALSLSYGSLLVLLLALSCFAYLCVAAMTAQRLGDTLLSRFASLTALVLVTAAAFDGFAVLSDEFIHSQAWIAIIAIGACAFVWRVAKTKTTAKTQKPAEPQLFENASTEKEPIGTPKESNPEETSSPENSRETQALLLRLSDTDAAFITKILGSHGCRILRDDSTEGIPASHFTSSRVQHLILFHWDETQTFPADIEKLRTLEAAPIRIVALSSLPHSEPLRQSQRDGRVDEILSLPPKAMELIGLLNGRKDGNKSSTRDEFRNVNK